MIDIQFIRDNKDLVKEKSEQKGYQVDVDRIINLDDQIRSKIPAMEEVLKQRNQLASQFSNSTPSQEQIEQGRSLKDQASSMETELSELKKQLNVILLGVPNMPLSMVPLGLSEDDNQVIKKIEPNQLNFEAKNHWELAEEDSLIDKTRATKVAGSRFVYLKGGLVRLQFAIINWVMDKLTDEEFIKQLIAENNLSISSKPFVPVLPPGIVNTSSYHATTRLDAEEVTYKLAEDDMWMNASAEHSLCNMYQNEILPEKQLPIRYLGYATSD